jgi:two-component system phosphate regulon sensor histidine kinase PhoR
MLLFGASLLALTLAGLVSTLATRRISRTLRQLAESAGRMVDGDLGERTRTPGHDEIATLGKSLDRLAENLSGALRQLKTERDLLGGILAGMQEGVLVVDRDAHVIHANPALRGMLLLGSDCIGKPLLDVIRNAELLEILRRGQHKAAATSGEVELAGIKPRRLMAHVSPLEGEPGDLLVVLVDVTQLRQLESIRKDFVANASHELRTPVASMRSAAETLRGAMDDPDAALSFLEIIERNAARLHQLVEDLLDLSRIESREFRLQLEPLDLGAFAELMAKSYSRLAQDKGIRLEVDAGSRGILALADRRAMEQVVGNLLDNAIKYCPQGATVQLRPDIQGDKVRVSVSDTGPGIPPQHLPRLFERFYRVDAGRSRELGGTGLGLAIVKHLVEAMGGTVSVESEAGLGAIFSFTLPRP